MRGPTAGTGRRDGPCRGAASAHDISVLDAPDEASSTRRGPRGGCCKVVACPHPEPYRAWHRRRWPPWPGSWPCCACRSAAALADTALALCAAQFGLVAPGVEGWAPHDPETGEVLWEELEAAASAGSEDAAPVAPQGAADAPGTAPPDGAAPPDTETAAAERPEAHQVIDRLVERLRAEGLGAEAARLVVRFGGYGRNAEESRELYGKLRSLLVGKVAVGS